MLPGFGDEALRHDRRIFIGVEADAKKHSKNFRIF
jgi:hypothetical protein